MIRGACKEWDISIKFKSGNLKEGDYLGHIGIDHTIKIQQS
jgi:hypothetical protein